MKPNILGLISHINHCQSRNGNFIGYSSPDVAFRTYSESSQTFHTSLVLCAVNGIEHETCNTIRRKGSRYLLSQKSDWWTWNYWDRSNPKSKTLPDDLDDTCMALAAIDSWDSRIIDEHAMVSLVQNLISAEQSVGGPYKTWIVSKQNSALWHDIDIGVNANITTFLTRKNITLEPLVAWIEQRIVNNDYSSKYYSSVHSIYFISKWYRGKLVPKLRIIIKGMLRRTTNPLDTALLASALLYLGCIPRNVAHLIKTLAVYSHKIPQPFPYFVQEIKDGVPWYAGSSALTAAHLLEVFYLYEKVCGKTKQEAAARSAAARAHHIRTKTLKRFSTIPNLKKPMQLLVTELLSKDPHHEIALLPHWFAESLKKNVRNNLFLGNDQHRNLKSGGVFLDQLGSINTLGWIGYTIIDKVLDGEDYKHLLPVSTICIREVSDYYQKLFVGDLKAQKMISDILDGIDKTNYWEHEYCKLQPHPNPLPKGERELNQHNSLFLKSFLIMETYYS